MICMMTITFWIRHAYFGIFAILLTMQNNCVIGIQFYLWCFYGSFVTNYRDSWLLCLSTHIYPNKLYSLWDSWHFYTFLSASSLFSFNYVILSLFIDYATTGNLEIREDYTNIRVYMFSYLIFFSLLHVFSPNKYIIKYEKWNQGNRRKI
jgi:hypothetical protein